MCVCVWKWKWWLVVSGSLQPSRLFSVRGILQARILEWVAIPFSRGSSWLRDQIWVSCIAGRFFTLWATREAHVCVCVCVCVHWKHIRGFVKWTPSPGINLVASTKDEDLLANCTVKLLGCPSRWLLQGQQNTYYSPGAKSQGRSEDLRHHCCL